MKYKIADLIVEFDVKSDMLKKRCEKYVCQTNQIPDLVIDIAQNVLQEKKKLNPEMDEELIEYMLLGSSFYQSLLNYNGCVLHSSAVVIDEQAYLFSAPCGTGKSTHAALWVKYLSEKNPYILNDDNPAIRIIKGTIYAYGTPFSGKHDISVNQKAKLQGICFLKQAKVNSIRKLEAKEAISLFLDQTVRELKEQEMLQLLEILDIILKEIPIYQLCCDMSKEAVELSYQTMKGAKDEN